MANLVRIRDVTAYTTLDENAAESAAIIKNLKDNNIKFHHLFWGDPDEAKNSHASLSTWTFTTNGSDQVNKTFTKFPIVHWRAIFDDDTQGLCVSEGLSEFQNSLLMANLDKVVNPS